MLRSCYWDIELLALAASATDGQEGLVTFYRGLGAVLVGAAPAQVWITAPRGSRILVYHFSGSLE